MAEQPPGASPSAGARRPPSPTSGPARRPRAPTITIDTSAVQRNSDMSDHRKQRTDHEAQDEGRSPSGDKSSPGLRPGSKARSTPTDLRPSNSFDSRDSRPTSPHNVSSPAQWNSPHNFLSVPAPRSRGQSFDTDASGESSQSASDVTYVNSTSPTSDHPPKAFDDHDRRCGAGDHPVLPDEEALKPDAGAEGDFERENNPFAFAPGHMTKLLNPKSLGAFHAVGGMAGLERGLRTNKDAGLSMDESKLHGAVKFEEATTTTASPSSDTTAAGSPKAAPASAGEEQTTGSFEDRKRIFDDNRLPERRAKSIWLLMWLAYNDKVLMVLTVAAVIALALGLYQALGTPEGGVDWIEGVAIIVAIVVVVLVGALNDWQKERQFVKLNKKKDDRTVNVIRSGKTQEINIHDLLVGDVLLVEPGDIIPVDGIYITGHGVRCDESSATGESDILKKTPGEEVYRAMDAGEPLKKLDPFMISGGKITEGFGRMLVTATGVHSSYGKTMLSLQESNEATPLQTKLNGLAEYIAKLGSAAAIILFVVLLIKFLAQLKNNHGTPADKGQEFMTILITAVTIVVVAVPEGLPLAVTLALAYATKRMLKDRNLVRVLRSCETMGNATSICSDKTGTLTQNVMTVVAGALGTSNRFSIRATGSGGERDEVAGVSTSDCITSLAKEIKDLWKDSIAINSTAFESEDNGKKIFVGSKTETALLDFARDHLGMDAVGVERGNAEIVQMIPFDSGRKCMGMVVKRKDREGYRLMVKGASEIMLKYCSTIVRDPGQGADPTNITEDDMKTLQGLIDAYAERSLRTIGFIYRDVETWPPRNARRHDDDRTQAVFEDICKNMTFLAVVGIQDPLRAGVPEAVRDCIKAGVFPRMVTGDNIITAQAIARECGIYTQGGLALEGPAFRKMSKTEQRAIIPKLQVLARSSPEDKRILVKRLKEMGETVAVTGDGTNDAPALKAADIGFSMNIAGTEVAKEASDIILMDDNFASIVLALMWGRAVNDAVRKFLQFQITVNITAVLLAFISAVSSSEEESVLTAVQLLWINLIMDTMAALALATDPPTRTILDRKPDPKSAPLFSVTMWKMIIVQAIYQLVVTLILYFAGRSMLGGVLSGDPTRGHRELQTLVFNTFVWMQIFNALNNRRLDNRFNVFEGILNNWFFICIFGIMIGGQVLIIFVGGWAAFQAVRQNGAQWGIALILGAMSLPVGVVARLIPDSFAAALVPAPIKRWANRNRDKVVVTDEEDPFEFNQALYDIKQELSFIRKYKGGRLNALRFAVSHPKEALLHSRSPSRSRASSSLPRTPNNEASDLEDGQSLAPPTPDSRRRRGRSRSNSAFAATAMAGIVAGSIAGGWSPIDRREGDTDSLRFGRDRSKSDLTREIKMELHPQTRKGDHVLVHETPVEEAGNAPPSQSTATTPQFGYGPFAGEPSSARNDTKSADTP
ncbi:calcium-translocating P-type ATPase [Teratosphaeria destructans]|uniref:Calcium-transporting ATPase n=1 Tax=Teratosphaeria destructans TaxID=418781 RepID=A0A9W7SQ21_9PEZI|nr:calcium-translocating P-type ATPase [Teratosphaeria destructans]